MTSLKGKKVLITGAGGFIGSHVVDAALAAGADVRAFFHYNGRNDTGLIDASALSRVDLFFGNLCDGDAVKKAVSGMDVVLHIGALPGIPYSYKAPHEVFAVNAHGTMNVLQAALGEEVDRVVVTSTSEVYGSADNLPITEDHPLKPQSPYAGSKVASDAMARSFFCSYGLPVVIARPFNTYGPRQSDRAVIPTVIKQGLWRDRITVGALHPKRDFVYVGDTARGFIACAVAGKKALGQVVQFATNQSWSVQKIIDIVCEQLAIPPRVEAAEGQRMRPNTSEVLHLLGTNDRAQRLIGWQPTVSFRDGLCRTIEYIRDRKDQYLPEVYRV